MLLVNGAHEVHAQDSHYFRLAIIDYLYKTYFTYTYNVYIVY